jgi:uncharacterized protein YkwD
MSRTSYLVILALLFLCPSAVIAARVISPPNPGFPKTPIPVTGAEASTGCGGKITPATNNDFEQAIVEQTNQIRMKAGLSPLKRVDELNNSARYHAADMDMDNYFSHNTFDRKNDVTSEICDTWQRIGSFYPDWLALAENIAAGQKTPEQAMNGWMNSPEHRENILSDHYWEIGVGFSKGEGKYRYYWVQNFGRSQDRFPLVINGEQAKTSQRMVSIYMYGEWDSFRLKNDGGDWGDWQSFTTKFDWLLPETPGMHTVSAEMRGKLQNASASDSIELSQK